MFPINQDDSLVTRGRQHIKMQVEAFKSKGESDESIIKWLENSVNNEIGLHNYYDYVQDLAEHLKLPLHKFNISWM